MTAGLQLGAPGIYPAPARTDRSFGPVRLDVAGFAGVAPRGPVDTPTPVRSWSDYQLRFGRFEGPGLLPYAVWAFFEQGGELAYVVRVGAGTAAVAGGQAPTDDEAAALFELTVDGAGIGFAAANPGTWGSRLGLRLEFDATPAFPVSPASPPLNPAVRVLAGTEILAPPGLELPVGTLLRLRGPGMPAEGLFRWVEERTSWEVAPGRREKVAVLDASVPGLDPAAADRRPLAAIVTGTLVVEDGDPSVPRSERLTGLGLAPGHPRFVAAAVTADSLLVRPVGTWAGQPLPPPDPLLTPVPASRRREGRDGYEWIDRSSFFDTRLDPDPDVPAGADRLRGATGLAQEAEIGLLSVPDLFWAWLDEAPPAEPEPRPASSRFVPCPPETEMTRYRDRSRGGLLDARNPDDLAEIASRQGRLTELAAHHHRFTVLLDVPGRLSLRGIAAWRAPFDTGYAAAYHPWLGAAPEGRVVDVPPSAFAAGIIAARERRLGLSWGPANELARGAVRPAATVTAAEHDLLHPLGINVFRVERDGFRLSAARTLSQDRGYRQLSVRRLVTMLRLALERQAQWVVFEPHTADLRNLLRHNLLAFLRDLFRTGAFAGASEAEAFFVRVGDDLNPRASMDLGRLVVEVGVAPAEPLEFIVVRIVRDGDGDVRVEEDGRG